MASDFISRSCRITTQNTRTSFATPRVFTLLQHIIAGIQAFLNFTLTFRKKNTVFFNVQFLSLFKNPLSLLAFDWPLYFVVRQLNRKGIGTKKAGSKHVIG